MKKRILNGFTGLCDEPEEYCLLPVPFHHQQQPNWCWAASAQMVMEFLGVNQDVSQGVQATLSNELGNDCCGGALTADCDPKFPGLRAGCNRTAFPDFWHFGFDAAMSSTQLGWDGIKDQIHTKNRPFVYGAQLPGGGLKHFVVVIGYAKSGRKKHVFIHDPLKRDAAPNNFALTYCEYRHGGMGFPYVNWTTYFDITKL